MIGESTTVSMNSIALAKKMRGEKVYNFSAGDPDIDNHPNLLRAASLYLNGKKSPYPPSQGVGKLKEEVAQWMKDEYKALYTKEQVLVTCGGKFGIFAAISTLLKQGEEVLIPMPYWVSYPEIVKIAGGKVRAIASDPKKGWKITAQDLKAYASESSKMLILNNACNPTGAVYTYQELQEILATAKELDLIVISDEVYSSLVYDGGVFYSCGAFIEHQDHVLVVQSCSKNFGMTGWRVGFILGPQEWIEKLSILQMHSTTGTASISQHVAIAALESREEVSEYMRAHMQARRDLFVKCFNELFDGSLKKPESGLYVFVSLQSMGVDKDAKSFCKELIEKYHVAAVPGEAFGIQGYVRLSFAIAPEEIIEGLQQLKVAINNLQGGI